MERELIANIKVDDKLPMKIVNLESNNDLSDNAIFVIPYKTKSGEKRIYVVYSEIIPILKVNRRGAYAWGVTNGVKIDKDFEVDFDADLETQVERQVTGYLSVLRMTKGAPVSLVVVNNFKDLPIENILLGSISTYKNVFMNENRERLDEGRAEAVELTLKIAYNPFSFSGLVRRLMNRTMTIFYTTNEKHYNRIAENFVTKQDARYPSVRITPLKYF